MAAALSLGLDIGTTTISAVVTDVNAKTVLASRTQKHNADIFSSNPEEKIQSPEKIESIARLLLQELLDRMQADDPSAPMPMTPQAFKERYFAYYDDVKDKSLKKQDW